MDQWKTESFAGKKNFFEIIEIISANHIILADIPGSRSHVSSIADGSEVPNAAMPVVLLMHSALTVVV